MQKTTALLICVLLSFTWATSFEQLNNLPQSSLTTFASDKEVLQQFFNGFFAFVNLPEPHHVVDCWDAAGQHETVVLIGDLLEDLNKNKIKSAEGKLDNYLDNLPESTQKCLDNDAEMVEALKAYHLWGLDPKVAKVKLVKYVITHIISLKGDIKHSHEEWFSNKYREVGLRAGDLIKKIFVGKGSFESLNAEVFKHESTVTLLNTNMEILQLLNDGWFDHAKLPHPTTIVNGCYNEETAKIAVDFVRNVLEQLAAKKFKDVERTLDAFEKDTPQHVKDCLKHNDEYQAVANKYRIAGMSIGAMKSKIEKWAIFHMPTVFSFSKNANNDFRAAKYLDVADKAGSFAQKVFGGKMSDDLTILASDAEIMQQFFNGLFGVVNLPEPQHVVECWDAPSQHDTVVLVGEVLKDLNSNKIKAAEEKINHYTDNLPESTKQCLDQSSEMVTALKAYNVWGIKAGVAKAKVIAYVITHFISLKGEIKHANDEWFSEKHREVGTRAGNLLKRIFGSSNSFEALNRF